MARTDPREFYKLSQLFLTIGGGWPFTKGGFFGKFFDYTRSIFLTWIFISPALLMPLFQEVNFDLLMYSLAVGSGTLFSTFKQIALLNRKTVVKEILANVTDPIFADYDDKYEPIVKTNLKWCKATGISFLSGAFLLNICLSIIPLFNKQEEFSYIYPLPLLDNRFPIFIYIMQIITSSLIIVNTGSLDVLAWHLMTVAFIQLKILHKNTLGICTKILKNNDYNSINLYGKFDKEILIEFKKYIKHHHAIINYVNKMEVGFTYIYLCQYLNSVILICIIAIGLIVSDKGGLEYCALVLHFCTATTQISVYFIFAEKIIIESRGIGDACYMTDWLIFGPKLRKNLFLMMERSKRPLFLTAGKFTILSYASMIALFRLTFSYFTALRQFFLKPN